MSLKVFVKVGIGNQNFGACLESQKILMLVHVKKRLNLIDEYEVTKVNPSKPPESFSSLGLRLRIPCVILNRDAIDDPDEIVSALEDRYPGGLVRNDLENDAEVATRNFFSRFSFYVRGIAKDSHLLEQEFALMNEHLKKVANTIVIDSQDSCLFLCGSHLSLIDCEILPKLHQVRVALQAILNYEIPVQNSFIWRYLNSAYNNPSFVETCPPDEDIVEHWSTKKKPLLSGKSSDASKPLYSFSVPVRAHRIVIDE